MQISSVYLPYFATCRGRISVDVMGSISEVGTLITWFYVQVQSLKNIGVEMVIPKVAVSESDLKVGLITTL